MEFYLKEEMQKLIRGANFDFGGGAALMEGRSYWSEYFRQVKFKYVDFIFHNTGARYIYNRSAAVTKTHPSCG